jgi:hypothetical protein
MREESVITRAIGVQHEAEIDLLKEPLDAGLDVSFSPEIGSHRKRRQEKERGIN